MSAVLCLESAVSEMRVRVRRLRGEASELERNGGTYQQARQLREVAAILEQTMWDVEDEADIYRGMIEDAARIEGAL